MHNYVFNAVLFISISLSLTCCQLGSVVNDSLSLDGSLAACALKEHIMSASATLKTSSLTGLVLVPPSRPPL